jgi:spore protease
VCKILAPNENLATFCPSVEAETGIISTSAIAAIATIVNPSHILVIDSLCCHDKERLGNNFQITNTGITPGSGVGRDNQTLDTTFLGVPTLALGVPLVIYLPTLHYVVPKMIDLIVKQCALIIAKSIMYLTKTPRATTLDI